MKMRNIEIEVMGDNYIVVRADTERFGVGEVMAECNTFEQAFDYIKRETGKDKADKLFFRSCLAYGLYTDWTGVSFPPFMEVI